MRTWVAAAVLVCAACGGSDRKQWSGGDPELFGVVLEVEPGAPFTDTADFRPRLKHVLDATSRYFGHDPSELDELRLVVRNHWSDCPGSSGPVAGCYTTSENTAEASMAGFQCLEGTAIAHELLHYFIGDLQHTDPRWATLPALGQELIDGTACTQSF